MEPNKNKKFIDNGTKTLAIIGLVVVLFLGSLGLIRIAKFVPDIFDGIASVVVSVTSRFFPAEDIIVSVSPISVENGEDVVVSFSHEDKEADGSYTFFYECRDGVYFEHDNNVVFCNTSYNFINNDNSITLEAFSTELSSVFVPVEIQFTRNGSNRVNVVGSTEVEITNSSGSVTDGGNINITPNGSGERTPGEKTEKTELFNSTTSGPKPSNPNGNVDLEPRILEVGFVDRDTNTFTATSTVYSNQRAAVRFEVRNVGDKTSGSWRFNAVLPTYPDYIHFSDNQLPLGPGDRIEYTIGFDSIISDAKEVNFVVNVDPTKSVRESNENNNIVKAVIKVIKSE